MNLGLVRPVCISLILPWDNPTTSTLLVLVNCDLFEPNGSPAWKLRYPWCGGSCAQSGDNGSICLDMAFHRDHTNVRIGACIVITTTVPFIVTAVPLLGVHQTAVVKAVRSIIMA